MKRPIALLLTNGPGWCVEHGGEDLCTVFLDF